VSESRRDGPASVPDGERLASLAARENRLNDLLPRQWIKFQKSWFIHNPPARENGVRPHPAKFPETLAREFIEFFTKRGQVVFDPMAGTGSALIAALRAGRQAIGVELSAEFAQLARERLAAELARLELTAESARLIEGDARQLADYNLPSIDYCLTSPPYWDMLHRKGHETQRKRRAEGLPLTYSDLTQDLGNIADYEAFVDQVCGIYERLHAYLRPGAYLTVVVKNVKKGSRMYPLAWDIGARLARTYTLKDERIWLQDNVPLAPFGMFNVWVSNTHHHYCLNFRK
jgi:DNA modification methylase